MEAMKREEGRGRGGEQNKGGLEKGGNYNNWCDLSAVIFRRPSFQFAIAYPPLFLRIPASPSHLPSPPVSPSFLTNVVAKQ